MSECLQKAVTVELTIFGKGAAEINDSDRPPDILAPLSEDDYIRVGEGQTVDLNVLTNDEERTSEIDKDSLTLVTKPFYGTYVLNGEGTITYTHTKENTTSDYMQYQVSDVEGRKSDVALIALIITPMTFPLPINILGPVAFTNPIGYSGTWDFGDGTQLVSELNPTHSYEFSGEYIATFTHNVSGFTFSRPLWVLVAEANAETVSFSTPKDSFGEWDFGDGSDTTTEQDPVHTYESEGVYEVVFTDKEGTKYYIEVFVTNEVVIQYTGGVQIGDTIIHSEDYWTDHLGNKIFTLIDRTNEVVYDETEYPLLFEALGTTTLEAIENAEGSEVPYKTVADGSVVVSTGQFVWQTGPEWSV